MFLGQVHSFQRPCFTLKASPWRSFGHADEGMFCHSSWMPRAYVSKIVLVGLRCCSSFFNCVNALGSITYPTQNLFFVKDWAILMLLSALPLARLPRIFSSLFDHVQPYLKQRSSFEVASQWAFGWDWQCRRRTSCGMLLHDLNDVDMFAWHVACKKICRIWR